MAHRLLALSAVVLFVGCVPVTEPVGDVTKAEPDKALVGTWTNPDGERVLKIDVPEVKGNPKGLMRMTALNNPVLSDKTPVWCFTSTVGKEKYGNAFLVIAKEFPLPADFNGEGSYESWGKLPAIVGTRAYGVFRYAVKDDELVINFSDEKAHEEVMRTAKINQDKNGLYATPAGWFAKYLEKNGSGDMFPAEKDKKLKREKK